ncbi:MAG: ornithine cyclodeaminase [Thermoplasmatales archaeon]
MYYVTERDVEENLDVKTAMEAVKEAFLDYYKGEAGAEARIRTYSANAVLNTMPAFMNRYKISGLKVYIAGRGGAKFQVLIFDSENLELIASIEANRLGQLRTGAVTALATSIMRGKCEKFALIGSGFQAETQLEGILSLFNPEVEVYSRTPANCKKFAEKMSSKFGAEIRCRENVNEILRGADVITCITDANEPIVKDLSFLDEYHLNLAGANIPGRREASHEVLMKSDLVVVEHLAQALKESSEIIDFISAGGKAVEFKDIVGNPAAFRGKKTVFKSMGIGLEDIAVGYRVLKNMGIL